MIAYDKRGAVFALTDGPELLLHDADSEAPLWRKTLDSPIVALGIESERVVAVTMQGTATWFGARTGDVQRTSSFDSKTHAARVDADADRVVAITEHGIVELTAAGSRVLADHGAERIALAPDGTTLLATANELVKLAPDGTRTTHGMPGVVRALAYHPQGFWLVGLRSKVVRWDGRGEPTHVTNLPPSSELDYLACSERAIGIAWNRNSAVALDWPSRETLGSLEYMQNTVEGIDFGPWPWLGVSIDKGDGNKLHLETGALHRSDTHPGREHHRWLVSVGGPSRDEPPSRSVPPSPTRTVASSISSLVFLVAAVALVVFLVVR